MGRDWKQGRQVAAGQCVCWARRCILGKDLTGLHTNNVQLNHYYYFVPPSLCLCIRRGRSRVGMLPLMTSPFSMDPVTLTLSLSLPINQVNNGMLNIYIVCVCACVCACVCVHILKLGGGFLFVQICCLSAWPWVWHSLLESSSSSSSLDYTGRSVQSMADSYSWKYGMAQNMILIMFSFSGAGHPRRATTSTVRTPCLTSMTTK